MADLKRERKEIEFKRDIYQELLAWKEGGSDKALELSGARQVGKTYILKKFASENFQNVFYINFTEESGKAFLQSLEVANKWQPGDKRPEAPVHKAMELYDDSFHDDEQTLIIMDEVQESYQAYNLIRTFTREFNCFLAVTGSYLGRLLDKEFFLPAGDLYTITLETLSFREFTDIWGLQELYDSIDLYGSAPKEEYQKLRQYFDIYQAIGGYPSVIKVYLETGNFSECRKEQMRLIDIFTNESKRYFKDILDTAMFAKMFNAISINLIREKQGQKDLVRELSDIIYKQESGRTTKKSVNHAIGWLQASHIIDYADESIDCDHLDLRVNARFYFMDIGMAHLFLTQTGEDISTVKGIVAENFVYCSLHKRIARDIAGDQPWFAIYQKNNGELDFYVRSLVDFKDYGIEVKSEDGTSRTAQALLHDGKLDYLYYLKGASCGGMTEEGKVRTVPLYLADRLTFDLG